MNILSQDIMYLPGVGPNKKDVLNKELGVRTWGDLLEYYPYKYVDRSRIYAIHELQSDMPFVQIRGKILSFEEFEMSARKKRVVAHFSDGRGVVDLVWFSGAQYIYKTYKVGEDYIVFGRPTVYGGRFQFSHPEIERASVLGVVFVFGEFGSGIDVHPFRQILVAFIVVAKIRNAFAEVGDSQFAVIFCESFHQLLHRLGAYEKLVLVVCMYDSYLHCISG